ncbi:MAG: PEP-CTERM sorting domain-containing protein [Coleofasciculus sp. A1-SPW-01]|uniref:PEP-CTERM sorting domain-containing protein n=1 Tax=Coleofasciculus sp. A1-SPW-01 TaxID=3070819 RepID=UPI0032FF1840
MKFSSLVPSVLAAAGIAVASSAFSPAQAALTSLGTTCNTSNVGGSILCEGAFSGNDSSTEVNDNKIFGFDTWSQLFKVDDSSGSTGGLTVDLTNSGDETEGTWSLTGVDFSTSNIMLVLKGGNSFSSYLLDGATSGSWNTNGILKGNDKPGPDLSHFTVYQAPKPVQDPEAVPEPLTILGSATALGIGGLLKRQQSKKNNKA